MSENFSVGSEAVVVDLFGDPVPPKRSRGRPAHVKTQENRDKVTMLLALGWNDERIAAALHITRPTLQKHYFRELKFREIQRDRLTGRLAMLLWGQVEAGNVAAIKEFRKLLEENDMMLFGQKKRPGATAEPKAPKLGKKAQARLDAQNPNTGTRMGALMARRAASVN